MADDTAPDDLAPPPKAATISNNLLAAGLVAGIIAMLPFFITPELNTARSAEIADHVIPGLLVLVAAGGVFLAHRRGPVGAMTFLVAALAILLAGIWMVSTHVPLLNQARNGDAPWGASLYHSTTAVIVLGVGVAWASAAWTQAE